MTDEREPQGSVPTVYGRRPFEIQAQEYYPLDSGPGGADATDPKRLLASLWRWKWWIAACTTLGVLGGVLAGRFIEPEYQVNSSIWIEQENRASGPVGGFEPLAAEGWSSVLASNAVLRAVVEDTKLWLRLEDVDADAVPAFAELELTDRTLMGSYTLEIGPAGAYELTRRDTTAVESGTLGEQVGASFGFDWTPDSNLFDTGDRYRFNIRSVEAAIQGLRQRLDVRFDDKAGIIYATLLWKDRNEGADVLNTVQDQFLNTATELKNKELEETAEILAEQTRQSEERLRQTEFALEQHKIRTITLPSEGINVAPLPSEGSQVTVASRDPVFDAYFQRKVEQSSLQTELQQLQRILSDARAGGRIDVLGLQTLSSAGRYPALQSALEELSVKEAQRRSLLLTYTEQQEDVQALTAEIDGLTTITIPSLIGDLVSQLETRLTTLDTQLADQTSELQRIPARSIEQARLEREVYNAAGIHQELQTRLKEAELAVATSSPGLQVLDRASPPLWPTENTAPRILLMASLAGLGLGVAGALLFDKFDKRIRYPDQVSSSLGLPVLGIVPRLDSQTGMDAEVAVEAFRSIRVQISHANGGSRGTLLVTSPAPRDGKSMVSANLAISYAAAGFKTVLVDADVRRGHAQEMFNVERSPGLTDYLSGRVGIDGLIQDTAVENLSIVARGAAGAFNAERLDSKEMDDLLAVLRERYDVVVLDAPPLAAGADVLVLGKRSDKVVIVLRAGETDSQLARTKLDLIGNVNIPIVGAVLNAVPTSAHYYPYYANYYYADVEPVA
ncbi:MAG: polysaccharide biosynthesis tyrosine autokinase [marine benthic group bacterium]|nr:polysaccharide biosynthesis tyrosine autokinase [Gemmatimonadota bacterium]